MRKIGFENFDDVPPDYQDLDSRTLGQLMAITNWLAFLTTLADANKMAETAVREIKELLATAEDEGSPSPEYRLGHHDVLNLLAARLKQFEPPARR